MLDSFLSPLLEFLKEREGRFALHGLKGSSPAYALASLARRRSRPSLLVTATEEMAERLAAELRFFGGPEREVLLFPTWDLQPFEKISPAADLLGQRMKVLHHLAAGPGSAFVVAPLPALLQRVLPREVLVRSALSLSAGQEFSREELIARLEGLGYARVSLVGESGEFAVRGHVVDVFSPSAPEPVRLEFSGDFLDAVRTFNPDTQRSAEAVEIFLILPAKEVLFFPEFTARAVERLQEIQTRRPELAKAVGEIQEKIAQAIPFPAVEFYQGLFYSSLETLFDFLPPGTGLFLDEPLELSETLARFRQEAEDRYRRVTSEGELWPAPAEIFMDEEEFSLRSAAFPQVAFQLLETAAESRSRHLKTESNERLRSELLGSKSEEGILRLLAQRIRARREEGVFTVLACPSRHSAGRLQEMLEGHGLRVRILEKPFPAFSPADAAGWDANLLIGEITRGFIFPQAGLMLIAESELFGEKRVRRRAALSLKDHVLAALQELQANDFVVHADHGIGLYRGLVKVSLDSEEHDFLILEYQGGDKLYLPVYRLHQVQKYIGGGDGPRLDKLGGTSWEKTKGRVKRSLRELAEELLQLYAARAVIKGYRFAPQSDLLLEFEASFEYEETPDQLQAIEEVQTDLGEEKPMDRLVCGDVGFGKTEVALRAAFRVMMDGKQAAVLVPTTVLAQQHYQTFTRRFAPYPFRVEMLSRFRSRPEQKKVLQGLKEGTVDLVIGTHRLLQRDVVFKELGLLIVDEEHRFGVTHKERLKHLRTSVDVLTLTATPIPRTLQMSLTGIRDLSVIETPPEDRLPIRTYVTEFDPEIIRDAVRRELRRGGQVFFVHNRVQSIAGMAAFLKKLVPEARIGVAHGQMGERELEQVMLDFLKKEVDVLVTTTIIESGLDFPAANTILINRADKLGLAQMYQLRGRVGRSKERAYAYLLVPGFAVLDGEARKRLEALQEVSELGCGLKLAMHDLEIRGAGALLGDIQSGHVAAVGYDMYLQLLERAVQELKGEEVKEEIEPEIDLPVPALLPADYVEDVNQRLLFYRHLSLARSEEEVERVGEELRDRYGPRPERLENLLEMMNLKLLLKRAGVKRVSAERDKVSLTFHPESPVEARRLVEAVVRGQGRREFTPDQRLKIRPAAKGWKAMVEEVKKLLREII